MIQDLRDRTVLVAGAGSGMGRATALAAARAGARLVLLGRTATSLEGTAAAIQADAPGAVAASLVADASDPASLARRMQDPVLARVDVLVNAVGTNLRERAFDQLTPGSWSSMLATNLDAAFHLSQALLPAMRSRGAGLLIHIASIAARKPDRSGAAYQASKAGVVALVHAIMEEEWQNGIRASAILPGMTDTKLLDQRPVPIPPEARALALQPEDVAEACLFVMRLPARAHVSELHLLPSRR